MTRRDVTPESWFELVHWLPAHEADALGSALTRELDWQSREIVLFGRRIVQPRLVAWAGRLPYRYSGQTLPVRVPEPSLAAIWQRVEERVSTEFNHVLVNRYRSGQDSMGMHADDEPELGERPLIVSLSLGATRSFAVVGKKKSRGVAPFRLALGTGDLLIMGGAFQHELRHGVPKDPRAAGERINLTFRRLERAPG